ncbi:hypothetical protein OHB26_35670 [Nocardia sp. NBC_01503]|uniref:hypothetical protein n=1 Tax=Nocardia sp. NBC_01503 TaxID=2975997 RepID=UPI002E7ABD5D|nr:hypothetical protein [Nocardia sp. NBC_01503]WTL32172.1 hypothetical protein OHB26_35670 [Nocardia sp. NBC_01503]
MQANPTALAFVDPEISGPGTAWDCAQVRRLARRLGYELLWPPEDSALPLADLARELDVDAVIVPAATHLDFATVDALTRVCEIECAQPPLTYTRRAVRYA